MRSALCALEDTNAPKSNAASGTVNRILIMVSGTSSQSKSNVKISMNAGSYDSSAMLIRQRKKAITTPSTVSSTALPNFLEPFEGRNSVVNSAENEANGYMNVAFTASKKSIPPFNVRLWLPNIESARNV